MDGEVEGLSSSESSKFILLSEDALVSLLFNNITSRGVGYVNFEDAGHPFGKGGASFFFFLLFFEVVTFLLGALVEDTKAFFVIERLADDVVDFFALLLDDVVVFPMVQLEVDTCGGCYLTVIDKPAMCASCVWCREEKLFL